MIKSFTSTYLPESSWLVVLFCLVNLFYSLHQALFFSPFALHLEVLFQEREKNLVVLLEVAASGCYMLLSRHAYKVVYGALQEACLIHARAIFKAENFFLVVLAIEYLFTNGPTKANLLTKLATFGVFKLQLTIEHKVKVRLRRLILLVNILTGP